MAEIINFRLARKRRAQLDKERVAAENRARAGRSKADRTLARTRDEKAQRDLDGLRLDPDAER